MSTKAERREFISRKAYELADSGEFDGWLQIEHHLRWRLNQPEARSVLDERVTRQILDDRCKWAKGRLNAQGS